MNLCWETGSFHVIRESEAVEMPRFTAPYISDSRRCLKFRASPSRHSHKLTEYTQATGPPQALPPSQAASPQPRLTHGTPRRSSARLLQPPLHHHGTSGIQKLARKRSHRPSGYPFEKSALLHGSLAIQTKLFRRELLRKLGWKIERTRH